MPQTEQLLQERYQLQRQLSNNPTRQTWLAEDTETQQQVIVKLLPFSPQTQWQDFKLFDREAQILKHLDCAEIPRYLDYFPIEKEFGGGLPWFALVQDYVPGCSLQQFLKKGITFSEITVKDIARELLDILIYLHELSPPVLHRDLKPSNIIQGNDGKIHLVDFGAVQDRAKAEGVTFTVVGTGGYAPPEQLWGRAVAASDLYALGATLIHLLTGVAPGELPQHRMRLQFRDKASLSPDFADWLDNLIDPAVEKRYSSAREALAALQATEQQIARQKVRYGRLRGLALLQYGALGLCLLVLPLFGVYRYMTEGMTAVSQMNRAQQAYFLEKNEFADTVKKLQIGVETETKNYQYEVLKTPLFVVHSATPRRQGLKGYVGFVILNPSLNGKIVSETLLCENSTNHALAFDADAKRPSRKDDILRCPGQMKEISGREFIPLNDKSGQIAYLALERVNSLNNRNQFSSATDTEMALNYADLLDSEVKARTLETIALYLSYPQYLDRVLQRVETIEDAEAKGRILLTIARRYEDANLPKNASSLRSRAFSLLQPNAYRRDDNDKRWLIMESYSELKTQEQVAQAVEIARSIARWDYGAVSPFIDTLAPSMGDGIRLEGMLQMLESMGNSNSAHQHFPSAARIFALHLKTPQQVDRVLAYIPRMDNLARQAKMLEAIAPRLQTAPQVDPALTLLPDMPGYLPKAEILSKLAPQLQTSQQVDRVLAFLPTLFKGLNKADLAIELKVYAQKERTAMMLSELMDQHQGITLQRIAPHLKNEEQRQTALAIARTIDKNTRRISTIEAIEKGGKNRSNDE